MDRTCPHKQALITRDTIGERVTQFWTIPWASHCWWGRGAAANVLYKPFREALLNPEHRHRHDEDSIQEKVVE